VWQHSVKIQHNVAAGEKLVGRAADGAVGDGIVRGDSHVIDIDLQHLHRARRGIDLHGVVKPDGSEHLIRPAVELHGDGGAVQSWLS